MLRSFAYAASAMEQMRGRSAPEGWEERARAAFLDGYLRTVEPSLLPAGRAAVDKLLSIFELEKAVYEVRYELNNRPDWVPIPVAGIARLLEEE
jgi:predicted trehalose synthase